MNNKESLLSIILPVRNAGKYLSDCLETLLKQTYSQLEIIAIDDCSKDDSVKILKAYQRRDRRVKVYVNKKTYGLTVCLNRAVKIARGSFITFMSPHDMSTTSRIKKQIMFLTNNPKIIGVGSQSIIINEANKHIDKTTYPHEHHGIYQKLLTGLSMQFESVILNKKLLPKDMLKFTTDAYPLVFSELFVKLQRYGKFANLSQYLYYHREHHVQHYRRLVGKHKVFIHMKLWVNSLAEYDYRPSIKHLLEPLVNPMKTIFQ